MFSKATPLALKAKKVYLDDSEWYIYYHALSGEELKTQILSMAHKPTDMLLSYNFEEISTAHKVNDMDGVKEFLQAQFVGVDLTNLIPKVVDFLNDAKLEYTNRPYFSNN